jgi:Tfp pilus assembly protein PilN
MNTRQSRIILSALLAVSVGVFSQAAAGSLTNPWQPAVEATTNAPQPQQSAQPNAKPTSWWEWLVRYAGGGR